MLSIFLSGLLNSVPTDSVLSLGTAGGTIPCHFVVFFSGGACLHNTLGAVLAGGQSLRMGQPDKFLLRHHGQSLLQRVTGTAKPQVATLVINANGDPLRLAEFHLPVIHDLWPDSQGPLAGIISVMSWAQKACQSASWLATFAADTPYFPANCVAALQHRAQERNSDVVYACSNGQSHYTFALWSIALLPHLLRQFAQGERSLHRLIQGCHSANVSFSGDPRWFFNFNEPHDWRRIDTL
jgi:molybdenum cofactor guanylyltransferase